ncbi:MAG: epoxide hydrolase family protein [Pseudomonadota bacterium]
MSAAIREFNIEIPQSDLDDLKQRLATARFPEKESVDDWSQGLPLARLKQLAEYWQHEYDWRRCEAQINQYPQFVTELDGLDIHFLHIRSPEPAARPLLITHGWPGSFIEFLDVIDELSNPVAHGGAPEDAYHLVIPSLPGYGFSGKPTEPGWSVERIAKNWDALMLRLGYSRYFAQGGDWGSMVTALIGSQNLGHCAGIHLNLVVVGGPSKEILTSPTPEEQTSLKRFKHYARVGQGYAAIQGTRPQTIGYALADSAVGQLAWIAEKFGEWSGEKDFIDQFDIDRLLDNISLYWFTNTAASSARLYWHSFVAPAVEQVTIPTACSLFPYEMVQPSRRWAEQRYCDIRYWNEASEGGHFAAMECPKVFIDEVCSGLRTMTL